jgi:hypothetical protein
MTDMACRLKGSNRMPHNRNFFRPIVDFLDRDGWGIASIDDAFVVFDWHPDPALVEYQPIQLDEGVDPVTEGAVEVGKVQLLAQAFTVEGFDKSEVETGVDLVQWWGRMPQFSKDCTAVNIMEQSVILVGWIGKATIVCKDILDPASTPPLLSHTDWWAGRGYRRQRLLKHQPSRV